MLLQHASGLRVSLPPGLQQAADAAAAVRAKADLAGGISPAGNGHIYQKQPPS